MATDPDVSSLAFFSSTERCSSVGIKTRPSWLGRRRRLFSRMNSIPRCPRRVTPPNSGNSSSAPDAAVAQAAVSRLVQAPQTALKLVAERLQPSRVPPDAELLPLIARLDSEVFTECQAVALKLAKYGNVIAPRLRMAIEQIESAELRLRCQELLQQAQQRYPQSASRLQETRAVQLLEWIGNEQALAQLQKLARGASEAHLTRKANQALAAG